MTIPLTLILSDSLDHDLRRLPISIFSNLNPNSKRVLSWPATSRILAALVAMREGKFTRFSRVVSSSWPIANGPSILINGCLGKHICGRNKQPMFKCANYA